MEYFRGTLVCGVFNIVQDIPKFNNLFGRQIKCIHTGQAEQPNLRPNHTTANTDNKDSDVASETDSSNDIDTGKDKKTNIKIIMQTKKWKQKQTLIIT